MILRRVGNKSNIASKIINYFPQHNTYIELFLGAGGVFFNKPRATYNFLNDLDDDVYNLFNVFLNQKNELKNAIQQMPVHETLFKYWVKNKETEPIKKAMRFLFLSNFSYLGVGYTLKFGIENSKQILLNNFDKTILNENCYFMNTDFRNVLKKISFRTELDKQNSFIYCDPPYINTIDNYSNSFKEQDFLDLLHVLENSNIRFAISEFNQPFILENTKHLNVIEIGERQNIKNRRTEILITNYEVNNTLF